MRIKRIEIIGFKSFPDKAVVQIDQPITAIVGPNGCGKSNIVDAMRWCMGEQSAKHLRGGKMEDVIFGGSDSRGPGGMAEVSLTFENAGFTRSGPAFTEAEDGGGGGVGVDVEVGDGATGAAQPNGGEGDAGSDAVRAASDADVREVLETSAPAIDFSQYSEVTITRRLFRDGTSEYLINKVPCRLRDVTDFFLGTGVGTKAYSIIEQGRIGMIVSAKPEDRRLVIEEAAGITKFKKKKQAAERRMDQTRQNLLRVSDIVGELEKQLGSLRRQAQKAERYKKYRAELRDIELWSASHRWLGAGAEVSFHSAELEVARTRQADAQRDHEAREGMIVATRADLAVEERRLSDLTQELYDVENRVQLGESQIDFQTREAKGLEERAAAAQGEHDGLGRQAAETGDEGVRVREELARREAEVAACDTEQARLDAAYGVARALAAEAQAALDAVRAELSRSQADCARGEDTERALVRRLDELALRLDRVNQEAARHAARRTELAPDLARLGSALGGLRQLGLDLGSQRESLDARRAELDERLHRSDAEVETLRTELHRRRSRLHSLVEIQQRYEGFARGTRAVMQHRPGDDSERRRIRGIVADVVEASAEYEPAVEAVLGERLGGILVESHEVGAAGVAFLKGRSEGRSSFIPVQAFPIAVPPGSSSMRGSSMGMGSGIEVVEGAGIRGPILSLVKCRDDFAPVVEHLLRDVYVVDSLPRALELWTAGVGRTLVTLYGDVLTPDGIVTGGSRDAAGSGVLTQKREIRELEEISATLEHDLADAQARQLETRTELSRVTSTVETLKRDAHRSELEVVGYEKDLARVETETVRIVEREEGLATERAELEAASATAVTEQTAVAERIVSARAAENDAERRQLGLIEGVTTARIDFEAAGTRLTEVRVAAARAGAERQAARAQLQRVEAQLRELAARLERLAEHASSSCARAVELRAEAAQTGESLLAQRELRRTRATELSAARAVNDTRVAALQVAEVEARGVRLLAERCAAEAGRLELKLHDLMATRRHLEEAMAERYRVELAAEVATYHLRAPVSDLEDARVRELRDLIDRMGEINLTAIEECEELTRRHDFLVAQKQDLEQALAQLEAAIQKINRTSRKLFRETFDAVNAKFKEVFPRLFRGGQAELRLVGGEDDLLDAGVEIFAQPPGKKNSTVDLLSGGEKALTAVSLVFAIFLIKPSPFCLLDEVDAPLDEANVGRYNDLVREMTDRSQFIVITHNKRTMEIADDLYGVTMEEPGCSKLVAVNLRGLERRARAA